MADRNIDETIRKPRRAKGTPFHRIRNYYTLGILAFGAISAFAYENWSETKKLKQSIKDGKFNYSDELQERILEFRLGRRSPEMLQVLEQLREKRRAKEEIPKEESRFVKLFAKPPDF